MAALRSGWLCPFEADLHRSTLCPDSAVFVLVASRSMQLAPTPFF
jgi:hypothetical protein